MNLEDIQNMWKKDSKIDDILLAEASLHIPQLHHKYLTLHSEYTLLGKKHALDLRKLEHQKWLYYSGKAPPEEYIEKPFPHKVMKGDVVHWVQVDEEIMHMEMKKELYNNIIRVLEEILKQIHQMSYNVKNAITWRQFTGGV